MTHVVPDMTCVARVLGGNILDLHSGRGIGARVIKLIAAGSNQEATSRPGILPKSQGCENLGRGTGRLAGWAVGRAVMILSVHRSQLY